MAESSEKKSNELPIPAITSIVLALAAILAHQLNPLDSPRPIIPDGISYQYNNIEDVNARLWQDPFSAISQHGSDAPNEKTEQCASAYSSAHDDKKSADNPKCKHTLGALAKSIVDMSINKNITVLGVMVPGGAYEENIENRRRTRYAVLSGLAVKDYAPEDREHIGYVENLKDNKMTSMPEKIPFEWFNTDKVNLPPVLVLWLDDTAFGSVPTPLKLTRDFVELIKNTSMQFTTIKEPTKTPNLTFKFIGPASSNTLQAMINELDTNQKKHSFIPCLAPTYPFEFYNVAATGDWPGIIIPPAQDQCWLYLKHNFPTSLITVAFQSSSTRQSPIASTYPITKFTSLYPDSQPLIPFKSKNIPIDLQFVNWPSTENELDEDYKTIQTYLQSLRLPSLFTRASLTDYDLANALAKELKLRGFEINKNLPYPRKSKHHIVIISEWDTVYGRLGLPKAMKEQLVPMESFCPKINIRQNKCTWPSDVNWIHSYSYMRGLDGVIPGKEKSTEESNKDKTQNNKAEINLERPEGQSQQDYLRRLAAHIDELKQQLENDDQGEIKAIGVLGSDAYDKLMILKALRPNFPKSIFFTTDLDTRLMHPKEFDVTRNLIVAASFNLQLAEKLQKSIPPFRDSYQTAHFFATQIALDDANNANGKKLDQYSINNMLGDARLFETGNNKAIALNYVKKEKKNPDYSQKTSNIINSFTTNLYRAIGLTKDDDVCNNLQDCKNVHQSPPSKNWEHFFKNVLLAFASILMILFLAWFYSKKYRKYLKDIKRLTNHYIAFDKYLYRRFHAGILYPLFPLLIPVLILYRFIRLLVINREQQTLKTRLSIYLVPQLLVLLVLLVIAGTISVICYEIYLGDDGEPFYWNKGVSIWPSEMIRLFSGILGCLFIANTIMALRQNKRQLTREFHLNKPSLQFGPTEPQGKVAILWNNYCLEVSKPRHLGNILIFALTFLFIACILLKIFGFPSVPYRGPASSAANTLVLLFSVLVFIFLVMTVFVTTLRSINLISELDKCHSIWPQRALHRFNLRHEELSPPRAIQRHFGLIFEEPAPNLETTYNDKLTILRKKLEAEKKYHLDEWLDIKFIAAHTKVVGKLVYYPFIILALMIFSRSKIFDNWDMPIGLVMVFASSAALTLGSALYLRREAEHARKNIIKKISSMKTALTCQPEPDSPACKTMEKQIDLALEQIQEINEGAFQSLTNDPVFQAFLIPFGGFGGVALLENFLLNGF